MVEFPWDLYALDRGRLHRAARLACKVKTTNKKKANGKTKYSGNRFLKGTQWDPQICHPAVWKQRNTKQRAWACSYSPGRSYPIAFGLKVQSLLPRLIASSSGQPKDSMPSAQHGRLGCASAVSKNGIWQVQLDRSRLVGSSEVPTRLTALKGACPLEKCLSKGNLNKQVDFGWFWREFFLYPKVKKLELLHKEKCRNSPGEIHVHTRRNLLPGLGVRIKCGNSRRKCMYLMYSMYCQGRSKSNILWH